MGGRAHEGPHPGETRQRLDRSVDHEAAVEILALESLEHEARQGRGREEQGQEARGQPGGQGEQARIELPADLRRVVLAERVRRRLESGRVPGLHRLSRAVEDARLRIVERVSSGAPFRVIQAVVQGLLERLGALTSPRDTLLRRPVRGIAPDGDFVKSVRHGPPSYAPPRRSGAPSGRHAPQ